MEMSRKVLYMLRANYSKDANSFIANFDRKHVSILHLSSHQDRPRWVLILTIHDGEVRPAVSFYPDWRRVSRKLLSQD